MIQNKFARIAHSLAYVFVACLVGIGFAEGLASFGEKVISLNEVEPVATSTPMVILPSEEPMGSDDHTNVLPVSRYNIKNSPQYINADSYLVGDLDTGEVIIEKDSNEPYPIASISKLLTAIVANERIPQKQEVVVSKTALSTYGPSGGLLSGEKVRAGDLIYPLLLESSNDVAELISEQFDNGEFALLMNEKALELGMKDSSFEEASGLSKNNVSTAEDLFVLAKYIYKEEPELLDITRIREFALLKHTWTNHNYMLRYDTFVGGKNGYTDEALRTTVSLFELPIKRATSTEIRPIGIIALHTSTREQDVVRLLDFLQKNVSLEQ